MGVHIRQHDEASHLPHARIVLGEEGDDVVAAEMLEEAKQSHRNDGLVVERLARGRRGMSEWWWLYESVVGAAVRGRGT